MKKLFVLLVSGLLFADMVMTGSNVYLNKGFEVMEAYFYGRQITANEVLSGTLSDIGEWSELTRTSFTSSSGNIVVSLNYKDFLGQGTISTNTLGAEARITYFPTSRINFTIGNPVGITINVTGNIKIRK